MLGSSMQSLEIYIVNCVYKFQLASMNEITNVLVNHLQFLWYNPEQSACVFDENERNNKQEIQTFLASNQLNLLSYEINRFCHLNWLSLISQEYKTRTRIQLTRHNNKSLWFTLDGRFCCVVGKLLCCCCEQFVRRHTFLSFFDLAQSRAHVGRARERELCCVRFSLSLANFYALHSLFTFFRESFTGKFDFSLTRESEFYPFWNTMRFPLSRHYYRYERKWSYVWR